MYSLVSVRDLLSISSRLVCTHWSLALKRGAYTGLKAHLDTTRDSSTLRLLLGLGLGL